MLTITILLFVFDRHHHAAKDHQTEYDKEPHHKRIIKPSMIKNHIITNFFSSVANIGILYDICKEKPDYL